MFAAMLDPSPLRLPSGLLLACVLVGCATSPPRPAEPPPDAVAEFLIERGLAAPPSAPGDAPLPESPLFGDATDAPLPDRDAAAGTVVTAMNFLGVGYRRGGNSAEQGFDCSGFTRHVFEVSLGLQLPRRADEQAHAPDLRRVSRQELQPGDLVFFNTLGRTFSHVGIYVGEGRFIHAQRSGARVRVESMDSPYWRKRYTGARRAEILAAAAD
jgi:cell wall-associated NlpC family hydrolase